MAEQYQDRVGEAGRGAALEQWQKRERYASRSPMSRPRPDRGPSRDRGGGFER